MTSKVFYYKMIKDGVKRRIWYGALMSLIFFVGFPLMAMLRYPSKADIGAMRAGEDARAMLEYTAEEFRLFVGGGDYFLMLLVMGAALLGAWSGLAWLHSRKKTDLMGALPVKREKLLAVESASTLILYLIPYTINLLLSILVGSVKGIISGKTLLWGFAGLGIHLLFFLTLYFCGAAAMLLTGKILTGILGTGVFLAIGPAVGAMFIAYPGEFWQTYVSGDGIASILTRYASPATCFFVITDRLCRPFLFDGVQKLSIWQPLVIGGLMLAVLAAVSFWLMKQRKAEAAEQSMAFGKTEGWIKAVILYPLTLAGGLFFQMLGTMQNTAGNERGAEKYDLWLWFGILFTLLLGSIVIEVIYHMDRKRILDHKGWTAGAAAAAIFTAVFFSFDLCGYDEWIPESEDLRSAYAYEQSEYWTYEEGIHNSDDYLKKYAEEKDPAAVLELARQGIAYMENPYESNSICWVTVLYQMENGKFQERMYRVPANVWEKTREAQFADRLYREAEFPILTGDTEQLSYISMNVLNAEIPLNTLSPEEKKELAGIYQKELENLSYQEIFAPDNGQMRIDLSLGNDSVNDSQGPINENFVKTLEYLNGKGIHPCFHLEDLEIQQINIVRYQESDSTTEDAAVLNASIEIRDPEQIKEAVKGLQSVSWGNERDDSMEESLDVSVTYKTDYASGQVDAAYEKGQIPEIVNRLLEEAEKVS